MKLLNNFLSMGYAAIYSEALMVGAKAGLSPAVFDSVISGGRMDCPFYQTFRKYVIERDRNAHRFTLANALKDVDLSRWLRSGARRRQSGRRGSAQLLRPSRRHRPRRGLRADAVGLGGGMERVSLAPEPRAEALRLMADFPQAGNVKAACDPRTFEHLRRLRLDDATVSRTSASGGGPIPRSARGRARRAGSSRVRSGRSRRKRLPARG